MSEAISQGESGVTPVQLVDRCARGCRGNLPGADGRVRLCAAQDRVDPGVHGMAGDGELINEVTWMNAALVEGAAAVSTGPSSGLAISDAQGATAAPEI